MIVGDFNSTLTPMERSTKQKISKEAQALNDTMGQLDLIDICRAFYTETIDFIYFSSVHGAFSRTDHMPHHTIVLNLKRLK